MPAFLQPNFYIILKNFNLTAFFLLAPLFFFGQSLTGLWVGSLSNDSNTVRKDQSFEIALTEYKGKVYGYSRSEFIVNDTLFYIMKRVKGTINDNTCEVIDDEIISYNFRGKLDKGVKVISTFHRNQTDSTWHLDGTWKTKKTKNYYSLTGKVALAEEKDLTASKIFPHLEELNLADKVAFYKEREESTPVIKLVKPERELTTTMVATDFERKNISIDQKVVAKPDFKRAESDPVMSEPIVAEDIPVIKKQTSIPSKTETKNITTKPVAITTAPPVTQQANSNLSQKSQQPSLVKQPVTTNIDKGKAVVPIKPDTISTIENKETAATMPKPDIIKNVAVVEGRKSEFTQEVNFSSDSLVLSLYDNGEIDGDTVTIYMNGEVLMARQGLKASAIKKTIYLTPGKDDEFTLVLFADNLGKYPPNTGLLVIKDGNDIYNLRFSADLQKNAGIIFRRKK